MKLNLCHLEDKFYACGLFGKGSINTQTYQAFVMKLSNEIVLEEFYILEADASGVKEIIDMQCSFLTGNQYLICYMISSNSYVIRVKLRTADFVIETSKGHIFQ